MNLTNTLTVVNLDSYEENGEWEIYKTESKRNVSREGGQGRAGQGRAGQGRAGQGREGEGRGYCMAGTETRGGREALGRLRSACFTLDALCAASVTPVNGSWCFKSLPAQI